MGIALEIVGKLWITVGPLVLMGILFIYGIAQGKWNHAIWAFIVFFAGILSLAASGYHVFGIFVEQIAILYDVNKATADILNIMESNPPSLWHVILLGLYTYGKYLVKLFGYWVILHVLGTDPKFWRTFFIWHAIMIMVAFFGLLDLNAPIKFLIKYEAYISLSILAAFMIDQPIKEIFGAKDKALFAGKGVGRATAYMITCAVSCVLALVFESQIWNVVDKAIFEAILGF